MGSPEIGPPKPPPDLSPCWWPPPFRRSAILYESCGSVCQVGGVVDLLKGGQHLQDARRNTGGALMQQILKNARPRFSPQPLVALTEFSPEATSNQTQTNSSFSSNRRKAAFKAQGAGHSHGLASPRQAFSKLTSATISCMHASLSGRGNGRKISSRFTPSYRYTVHSRWRRSQGCRACATEYHTTDNRGYQGPLA